MSNNQPCIMHCVVQTSACIPAFVQYRPCVNHMVQPQAIASSDNQLCCIFIYLFTIRKKNVCFWKYAHCILAPNAFFLLLYIKKQKQIPQTNKTKQSKTKQNINIENLFKNTCFWLFVKHRIFAKKQQHQRCQQMCFTWYRRPRIS